MKAVKHEQILQTIRFSSIAKIPINVINRPLYFFISQKIIVMKLNNYKIAVLSNVHRPIKLL